MAYDSRMSDLSGFVRRFVPFLLRVEEGIELEASFCAAVTVVDHFIGVIGRLLPLVKILTEAVGRAPVYYILELTRRNVLELTAMMKNIIRRPYRILCGLFFVLPCTRIKDQNVHTLLSPVEVRNAAVQLVRRLNSKPDEDLVRSHELA